ncbi:3-oxoacyl-[acyl-carrier-protein] reductase FabG-like [Penaeus japonicus]|uniref:3-oxoacyl-[acyl-carrier-protein] reductase FabG-like n=1 Tax=Penaeus japonicus TaxID=27405 RepID=UPI001C70ECF6|nr:3-oxoacyl-[acyl-carrier-protein] reductase FabG-like [Penaeus japonicus]
MDTNVKAPFFLTQAAAPHLKATKGSVINLGDIIGEQASPPLTIYGISKAALIMATKNHAIELGPEVRVNYICPGAVAWPEVEQDHHDDAFRKEWLARTPLGKIGTAEDVADAVVFLASPSSSYLTGSGITVCGGRSLRLYSVSEFKLPGIQNNIKSPLMHLRPNSAHVISGDLSASVAATAQRLVAEAQAQWGRLDLLVNNASLFFPTPIADATEATWTQLMNTNVMSPYFLMQAAAPHLKAAAGNIINLGDIGGETPTPPYFTVYSMTKAALIMASKQLAVELAPEVRVNYINPGAVIWPEADVGNTYQKEWLSRTPLGREGSGEDVAEAAVFLASPAASYITGSSINVCGGRSVMN